MPIPISFLSIEEDEKRYRVLREKMRELQQDIEDSPSIGSYSVQQGDCEAILNSLFRERQERNESIGPAPFSLDQFGFADVSMELIARIMSKPLCEVFSYLNWDHMSRFLGDETKWPVIDKAYGGNRWKPALHLEHQKRAAFMLQEYKMALKDRGKSTYVWQFAICDDSDKLLYWLFFCTNSLRGLEEMKKAMWRVDGSGGFRFSDEDDPSQLHLFSGCSERALADELTLRLGGGTFTVGQIEKFVLTETPAYKFRRCLGWMERNTRLRPINPPPHRQKGTLADKEMLIEFLPSTTA